jgi:hypothetical protein
MSKEGEYMSKIGELKNHKSMRAFIYSLEHKSRVFVNIVAEWLGRVVPKIGLHQNIPVD